jgi:hypothetical protein
VLPVAAASSPRQWVEVNPLPDPSPRRFHSGHETGIFSLQEERFALKGNDFSRAENLLNNDGL